jgi:DNA-binding NarL/FixJ family response regulator
MNKTPILIVDDHLLFSQALTGLIKKFKNFEVIDQLGNGQKLINYFKAENPLPEIVLMDVNMPIVDGIEATEWLKENYPDVKVLALTMNDEEPVIIKMLLAGACGYLLKDIHPKILLEALKQIKEKGVFYTDDITETLIKARKSKPVELKQREITFLELACSDLTYKQIAHQMSLSPKTIDGYREVLFDKFNVASRVGMVLYAIKEKLVEI